MKEWFTAKHLGLTYWIRYSWWIQSILINVLLCFCSFYFLFSLCTWILDTNQYTWMLWNIICLSFFLHENCELRDHWDSKLQPILDPYSCILHLIFPYKAKLRWSSLISRAWDDMCFFWIMGLGLKLFLHLLYLNLPFWRWRLEDLHLELLQRVWLHPTYKC